MNQDIADLATCTETPDMKFLFGLFEERKVKTHLTSTRMKLRDRIFAGNTFPDLLKHAAWHHIRRSATPEKDRGGLSNYPIDRGELVAVQDLECLRRGLWASCAMHGLCTHMKTCSVRNQDPATHVSRSTCFAGVEGSRGRGTMRAMRALWISRSWTRSLAGTRTLSRWRQTRL